jgi:nucleolar protein 56
MTDDGTSTERERAGWFEGVAPDDAEAGAARIREGRADAPADWPEQAVAAGFTADESDYYASLREAALRAAREGGAERERADDQQLVHAVRAMAGTGVEYARELAEREGEAGEDSHFSPPDERLVSLARRVADLADEADRLRAFIERETPEVAPNLAALAGPVLAARLVSLAGGLESLAKKPSGTVQVLGAEDSLFAHLRGRAPSPKHGVIFTHEYVRGTRPEKRGSAARAFAGKLAIAARVDYYSGDRKPEVDEELRERIEQIRGGGGDGGGADGSGDGTGAEGGDDK